MKSVHSILIISIIGIMLLSLPNTVATTINSHEIDITTIDDTYSVEEKITIEQTESIIQFYVQSGINDLSVIINNTDITVTETTENLYEINYSQGLDNEKTTITITYSYPKKASMQFTKEFIYNTTSSTITFDDQNIASYELVKSGTILNLEFPEQQDTSKSLNLFSTILIGLLIVLLLVTTMYGMKKRKNGQGRNRGIDSTELLATEKSLLMNVLKEIEKKHRDKKISDETYEKLKTHYKQQTVDIMSNLED